MPIEEKPKSESSQETPAPSKAGLVEPRKTGTVVPKINIENYKLGEYNTQRRIRKFRDLPRDDDPNWEE